MITLFGAASPERKSVIALVGALGAFAEDGPKTPQDSPAKTPIEYIIGSEEAQDGHEIAHESANTAPRRPHGAPRQRSRKHETLELQRGEAGERGTAEGGRRKA